MKTTRQLQSYFVYGLLVVSSLMLTGCYVTAGGIYYPASVGSLSATTCITATTYTAFGLGTQASPYLICNPAQLASIASDSTSWASYFQLTNSIDMSAYNGSSAALTMNPIGTYNMSTASGTPFTGSFDGKGYTINNLQINTTSTTMAAAMFGYTSGATIQNLLLTNVQITGPGYIAALVGYNLNTPVTSVTTSGTVTQVGLTYQFAAGLVAYNVNNNAATNANITTAVSSVTVTGYDTVGGLIARNNATAGTANVSNSSYSGSILQNGTGGNTFGGLIGYNYAIAGQARVSNSTAGGTLTTTGTGSFSGGFIGTVTVGAAGDALMTKCSSTMTVTSPITFNAGDLGGLIGSYACNAGATSCNINQSYFAGTLTVAAGGTSARSNIGGLIGILGVSTSMTISNSYAVGTMNLNNTTYASTFVGGFIGRISNGNSVTLTTSDVYASTTINGTYSTANTGEFVGYASFGTSSNYTATASYYDSTYNSYGIRTTTCTSGCTINTPTALTQANTLQQSSFTGFDFSGTWYINNGVSSPTLL